MNIYLFLGWSHAHVVCGFNIRIFIKFDFGRFKWLEVCEEKNVSCWGRVFSRGSRNPGVEVRKLLLHLLQSGDFLEDNPELKTVLDLSEAWLSFSVVVATSTISSTSTTTTSESTSVATPESPRSSTEISATTATAVSKSTSATETTASVPTSETTSIASWRSDFKKLIDNTSW